MAAQRIEAEVAEAIAFHHICEQPSIASMCKRWSLSRPTVKSIIDGTHPSLSAKTRKKLNKPVQSVTAMPVSRSGRVMREKPKSDFKKDLADFIQQANMLKKMASSLARQHA